MSVYVRDTTVYATDANKHKATGAVIKTSSEMAEHLVANGMASHDKPEGTGKTKKQKSA